MHSHELRFLLSVVVPMYYEEKVAETCYQRIRSVLNQIEGMDYELIFVNDGSQDATLPILKTIAANDPKVKVISFSRNFGHQIAITAGIDYAKGDAVVVIDADLQDPPELIKQMLEKWKEGYKVVYARRITRKGESVFKRVTAKGFYRLMNRLTDVAIPLDTGDFRLMDRQVVDELKKIKERNRFVRGIISWIGFKQTAVDYVREPRFAGETKYPLRKMLKFALDGITSFSSKPLKLALNIGFFSLFIGLLLILYAIGSKLVYPETTISGWTSLMIIIVFFGGIQLITIGIIGEYIARIYDESKERPLYIVEEKINV